MVSKVFSYLFWALLLVAIYMSIITVPVVKKVLGCHDASLQSFDSLEVQSRAQGWSDQRRCEIKKDAVVMLSFCLYEATSSARYTDKIYPLLSALLPYIRPTVEGLGSRTRRHNDECVNYPRTLIESADINRE
ncbi:hypothetical protein A2154_03160 [Candidatus Gottesmanbacteria bacterium RBG_16_43_7]|uniref:Uncharacterized protein n=1 Tax=Candidatus Gottesmanbacteria bacterium RBG_16_43_7 TaxID=1798373 RepID=A0A1F5ZA16_9BACT|nr:MAG: hypothetical protein A2154_03160 [Candidatus Gottesmanbacteria bacterium RBG_16_43_7]